MVEKKGFFQEHWDWGLDLGIGLGAIFLVVYGLVQSNRLESIAIALLLAGAALAIGVLIGFLFGIPRTLQQSGLTALGSTPASSAPVQTLGVNTNLEQISDWLTKIIVGVGLVQLTQFPASFQRLANYFSTAFGSSVPGAIVAGIILYFGIFGFLLGYLWTRLYLTGEFSRAEREAFEKPEYYEGLIHAFLYQPPPKGFGYAIEKGTEYNTRFTPNARVWSYLAFAYGQKYAFLKRAPQPDQQALTETRNKALEALRSALQYDPGMKDFLREYWDPQLAKPSENDLVVFFDDEDFKKELT
jgi:hypothetical protein